MWNDTDTPLAYLITFRTYGTWLHGDERGSIDRFQNLYGTPLIQPDPRWLAHNKKTLTRDPVSLDAARRRSIEWAIRETCHRRDWSLHAINVRTNHIHVVVSIGQASPSIALNAMKANATRQMREDGCWQSEYSPWSVGGSKRHLWNTASIDRAIEYVVTGQGDELPQAE